MGSNPIGLVSLQEEEMRTQKDRNGGRGTEGRPCEDAGRRWPSASQPRTEASEGASPPDALIFDL